MEARQFAIEVIERLRSEGHLALMAGGCVRDELLGRAPSDYDVATDAPPDRITQFFPKTAEVGASFGVVLVKSGPHTIEVATFRSDGKYTDSRRPDSVTFSNPRDDATRRDYTVNALFWSPDRPSEAAFEGAAVTRSASGGWIVDFISGLRDLEGRVIRAVGDPHQRLAEDHLRALRAVRLAAKLGFEIHPDTATAITRHASDLRGISRERIGDELRMMLEHSTRVRAVRVLQDLGLVVPVMGWAAPSQCTILAALPAAPNFPVALAAWLMDAGRASPADLGAARTLLMLSNDERDRTQAILSSVAEFRSHWDSWPVSRRKREIARESFVDALTLLQAVDSMSAERIGQDAGRLEQTPSGIRPVPLVTGDTLTALGLRPGPAFKRILDGVYDAQLDDRVADPEAARRFALELARSRG
ncbi:MAG: CCA tRNA nucleotidyltransferase [Phycisphaerales bacterium]